MILVTGSSGLIGRAICHQLINSGEQVRCHVRNPIEESRKRAAELVGSVSGGELSQAGAARSFAKSQTFDLDFLTGTQLQFDRLVDGCDTIIHTAGLVHSPNATRDAFERLNSDATSKLVLAANRAGVRTFVLFSTSAVYGSAFKNIDESEGLEPLTTYAASKIACENFLRQHGEAAKKVVLRPSLVFGEGDRGNMLSLIRQIKKKRYVNISGNSAQKSIIFAEDAALATQLCLQRLQDGMHVLNLANEQPISVNDLSIEIAEALGCSAPLAVPHTVLSGGAIVLEAILRNRSPLTRERLSKLTTSTTLDVSSLIRQTGFKSKWTVRDAIQREIAWARATQLL